MTLFTDRRAGSLVWLTATAAIAVLGYWYPMLVAQRNAAPDDRFGVALFVGIPFVLLGSIAAVLNYMRLLSALMKTETRGSPGFALLGTVLLLVSVLPAMFIVFRFVS